MADANNAAGASYGAFLAARYADAQQEPAAASRFYQQALQTDPHNQNLLNEGFLAALLAGSASAQHLAARLSGSALAVMLLGNQAAMHGDYAGAAQHFAALPQSDLLGLLQPLLLGWMQSGAGQPVTAVTNLLAVANNNQLGPIYVLNAALIADQARDMKDAVPLYAAVANANQQLNLRLAQILASWQARQGQTAAAQAVLQAMVAAQPGLAIALPALQAHIADPVVATPTDGLAEAYLTLAGSLNQPEQLILCVTFLQFALQLRPDLTAARLLLATVLTTPADAKTPVTDASLSQALAVLQPVAANDPLYAPVAMQKAGLLAALGHDDQAVALLDQLAAAHPQAIDPLEEAGDIRRTDSQFGPAIVYYNRAIALLPQPAPPSAWSLYYDRGISKDQQGNWPAAEPDLLTALALSPNQPYVLNYLGYTYALRGEKLNQAAAMLRQAVGLDPGDGAVIDSLGYLTLRQGHITQATQLLVQAVELDPDDAEVNAHLGDAFWAGGQTLQASYQWQRALNLKPDAKLQAQIENKLKQVPPA